MNDIRHFLIKLLAGERTVILNATISNGHIYLEKGKEFIVENNVVSHDDKYSDLKVLL